MDPKTQIVDEVYENLRSSLLHTGRGRPTKLLPNINVNNKLLVQLAYLREEGKKSWSTVDKWLVQLVPAVASMEGAATHFYNLVESARKTFVSVQDSQREDYLALSVDFDFISESLSAVGITRKTFSQPPTEPQQCHFTNQLVVDIEHFRKSQNLPKKTAIKWLSMLGGHDSSCLPHAVDAAMKIYDKLQHNKHRNPAAFEQFLTSPFTPTRGESRKSGPNHAKCVHPAPAPQPCTNCSELHMQLTATSMALQDVQQVNKSLLSDIARISAEKEANSARILALEDTVQSLKTKLTAKSSSERARKRREYSLLRQKQKFLAEKKASEETNTIKLETLQRKVKHLESRNLKLSAEHRKFREQSAQLGKSDVIMEPLKAGEKNRYSDPLRKTILALVSQASVSPANTRAAIQIVARHLFNVQIPEKELPCTSTATNICDEGHALAIFQVGETMANEKFILHLDGTSRDQRKFIGHQISLTDGSVLSLGFRDVAIEDAETTLSTTISLLQEVADFVDSAQQEEVFRQIIGNVAALMTDRAAVMKLFSTKFEEFVQQQLNKEASICFLHCNAHFLLGLSRACEDALKSIEATMPPLGRANLAQFSSWNNSASANRVIMTASDLLGPRGDQKSGCRQEWLAYCQEHDLTSCMTSFRSNRFNSFFEGAAALIHHREDIVSFFSSGVLGHSNLKMQSVNADCSDNSLILLVAAVSVIFFKIAAPYWKMVNTVSFTSLHDHISQMETSLMEWIDCPAAMFEANNIFKDECWSISSQMETATWSLLDAQEAHKSSVLSHLKEILQEVLKVTQRQLGDFLGSDARYNPNNLSAQELDILKCCPVTNLTSERAFGDLDHDMNRRKKASLHHRSSVHMTSQNNTMDWMDSQTSGRQGTLLARARKAAPDLRKQHREQEKLVIRAIRERLVENLRRKNEKEEQEAKIKEELIARVASEGGPVRSAEDVRCKLTMMTDYTVTKQKEILKDEIRFQKLVLKKRSQYLKLSGNVVELARNLIQFFDPEASTSCIDPPSCRRRAREEEGDSGSGASMEESLEDREVCEEFHFSRQGQWVAVFYDQTWYIGQVTSVTSTSSAVISFMEQTKSKEDYFRWPKSDDIADVEAKFVFHWDFDVAPVSSDGRIWQVAAVKWIKRRYDSIKAQI